MSMTKRERIEKALAMQKPDRMPFSMWMHFPNNDRSPRRLAEMSLYYQRELDLDFVKYMPYGMFSTVDYGMKLKVFPGFCDAPVAEAPLVVKPEDWNVVKPVSGTEGEYAIVLESQRFFLQEAKDVPLIQTVFSPLTTALKITAEATFIEHIRNHPAKVREALEKITATPHSGPRPPLTAVRRAFSWHPRCLSKASLPLQNTVNSSSNTIWRYSTPSKTTPGSTCTTCTVKTPYSRNAKIIPYRAITGTTVMTAPPTPKPVK
jgi:hypothetical protein